MTQTLNAVEALERLMDKMKGISRDLAGGACGDADPELFYNESFDKHEQSMAVRAAKRICVGCPIRDECLRGAMERNEPFGVWGGTTPTERLRLRQRRRP